MNSGRRARMGLAPVGLEHGAVAHLVQKMVLEGFLDRVLDRAHRLRVRVMDRTLRRRSSMGAFLEFEKIS